MKSCGEPYSRRRRGWIACLLLAAASAAPAADEGGGASAPVPPEAIVRAALEHSLRLRSADRDLDAAAARKAQAAAQARPSLDLGLGAYRYEGLRDAPLGPGLVIPALENRFSASISASQPLYTGGRIRAQEEAASLRSAAARFARRGAEADVVLDALTAYWNWSKAFHGEEALRAAVARMEAHDADMQTLLETGMATDNETLATAVLLDQTRLRLDEARRRIELARARLAFLTGRDWPADAVPERAAIRGDAPVPAEGELLETARRARPELVSLRAEAAEAEAAVKVSRSALAPQLVLLARYEEARPNNLFFPPEDRWDDDAFVGAALTWNLFDAGLARAKVAEARARARQAALRVEQAAEGIALEVREARIALRDALDRIAVVDRVVQSAKRNLGAASDLWQAGLARHSDILDAHSQLTDAEYQAVAARADAALAAAAVDHAAGRAATAAAAAAP